MIAVRNYPEKVEVMRRLKGNHFDHDSSKSENHLNQSECTLTKPASTDESSEDDYDMFQQEDESEDGSAELKHEMPISEFYSSVTYGFQLETKYRHEKTNADIMTVVYNSRLRGFVILDTRGIVTCKLNRIGLKVERVLLYPKYQHRVITLLQYVKKYNCYFVLDKDFIVKVLNKDFEEVYSMDSETIGASFMVFNSVTDELFTGGVGGTKIWQFHKISAEMFTEIKHLSNYRLTQKTSLPKVGGSWVQKIEVNPTMKHLYCCSEMSVHVYNMTGKLLYYFEQAHTMKITGCCYCHKAKVFATSSWDTTVKIWGLNGSLLHTFRGHSKAISNLILHPKNPLLLMTSSFDGTIKMWSLETLDQIYSLLVYTNDGPMWMFLAEDSMISIFNPQQIKLWSLNHCINFWNLTRCEIFHMSLQTGDSKKSTRLMAVGIDSSLRLFSRKNGRKLCTVLPPPCLSPLERLLDFCYSRELNLVYLLLNPDTIWIYTSRTDPACRLAKWDTGYLQKKEGKTSNSINRFSAPSDFAVECWVGDACQCTAICILTSPIVMTADVGQSCPDCQEFLLLGLEDGRILFMDQIIKGLKYLEFKASKDAITGLHHDKLTDSLVTKSKLNDQNLIQIWSLPYLKLQFNIPCALNLTTWTRMGLTLLTGYMDGHLFWHTLIKADDYGPVNPKMYPEFESDLKSRRMPPHQAEILNVDACPARLLLSSCSSDGNIKIWETPGTLIREIILDDSLGSICFLNDLGDLLVSFQNHIFCIPHSKVYPHSKPENLEMSTSSAEESDIYEDPSIMTEDLITNKEEPDGMKSYLVPYQMDFSKYFLPGKLSQMTAEVAEQKKDLDKTEKSIEKVELLEENLEAAPTEVYLSPRETLSESWSSTSFLSHVERLDFLNELDFPALNSSEDENHLSQLSETNSPIEDVKDQLMDSEVLQEEISPVSTEISEPINPLEDSKWNHAQDATHEAVTSAIHSTTIKEPQKSLEKENSKDILPDFFAAKSHLYNVKIDALDLTQSANPEVFSQNNNEYMTRHTSQESHTSQKIKKPPSITKNKSRKKKFIARHKKCVNKQDRKCKDHHGNTDYKESNSEMTSLPTAEEYTPQKNNSTSVDNISKEGDNVPTTDKLLATQMVHSFQMSNDSSRQRRHSQTAEEEEIEIHTGVNNENHQMSDTENEALHQPNVEDSVKEIPELRTLTKTKGNNSLMSGRKELDINSQEDDTDDNSRDECDSSPEFKYLPMTIKITPHQSEHQVNKAKNNEGIPLSKFHPAHNSRSEHPQNPGKKRAQEKKKQDKNRQTEFHIRLDEFSTKFSGLADRENNTKVSSVLHSQDENNFGKDWYKRQIERHHLRQMQKNLRFKSVERQRQMLAENKINHERDYNEKSPKIMGTSQAENGKITYVPESQFFSPNKMHPAAHFPKSKNPHFSKTGKSLHVESGRCKSAPVSTDQNKTSNKDVVYSSTPGKTPTHLSDQQYCLNSEISEDGISNVQEIIIEKQEFFTNYRLSFPKSQVESPRRPKTSSSGVSDNARKYQFNNTSLRHTKSIPEKSGPCEMIVFGDSVPPEYRFPTPLEVRLLTKRFPQMSTRILYHHYTQPHLPNRRITSAPSGRYFFTHNP